MSFFHRLYVYHCAYTGSKPKNVLTLEYDHKETLKRYKILPYLSVVREGCISRQSEEVSMISLRNFVIVYVVVDADSLVVGCGPVSPTTTTRALSMKVVAVYFYCGLFCDISVEELVMRYLVLRNGLPEWIQLLL